MTGTNEARRIEALVRLDVAIDQLLTASLVAYDQNIITESQHEAIHNVLDLFDIRTIDAMRVTVGLDVASMPCSSEVGI